MKKILFVLFATLFSFNGFVWGENQKRSFDKETYLAKRSAFITAEMGLTPEEATAFIPLCNELHEKMYEVGRKCRKLSRELKRNENASDAEYLRAIDEAIEVDLMVAELEREYYKKFKAILPPKKLYKYRNAEMKYAKSYMKDHKRDKDKGKKK